MNRESFSGILYQGLTWGNYCNRTDLYLKPLDITKVNFKKETEHNQKVVTKLVVNGVRI